MKQILGVFLLALPFLALTARMAHSGGLWLVLRVWGVVALIVLCFYVGFSLLWD